MSEIIGKEIEVGVAVEGTRGTASSTVSRWIRNNTVNLTKKAEHANDEAVRGVFEDMEGRRVVKSFVGGSIEIPVFSESIGYFLYNLYGSVVSSVDTGTIYKHIFNLEQSSITPSLTLFVRDGGVQQLEVVNSHINTLEISSTPDGYVKASMDTIGKSASVNTATPSYTPEFDFVGKEVTVKVADTKTGLGSATPLCVKDLTVTFDKGLIADHCLGSEAPADFYASKMSIEGSFKGNFETNTFEEMFVGGGAKYMEIKIEGETVISGTTKPSITLVLNKVQVTNWDRSGSKDDLVTEDVEFKAYYNATDGKASELTIINSTEKYKLGA